MKDAIVSLVCLSLILAAGITASACQTRIDNKSGYTEYRQMECQDLSATEESACRDRFINSSFN